MKEKYIIKVKDRDWFIHKGRYKNTPYVVYTVSKGALQFSASEGKKVIEALERGSDLIFQLHPITHDK